MNTLAIINGWGMPATLWDAFAKQLQADDVAVEVIDLPRQHEDIATPFTLAELTPWVSEKIHEAEYILGWSLGGNVAREYALANADQVKGLLTIGTTPKFIQQADWPHGMELATFEQFYQSVAANPQQGLQQFARLLAAGDGEQRQLLKQLRGLLNANPDDQQVLCAGLTVLAELDQRQSPQPACSQLHLLGEGDVLAAAPLAEIQTNSKVLAGVGHAPMLSQPQNLAVTIKAFIDEC